MNPKKTEKIIKKEKVMGPTQEIKFRSAWDKEQNCGCIQITDQTHRGGEFGKHGEYMSDDKKCLLISDGHPALVHNIFGIDPKGEVTEVYVRGKSLVHDNEWLLTSRKYLYDRVINT